MSDPLYEPFIPDTITVIPPLDPPPGALVSGPPPAPALAQEPLRVLPPKAELLARLEQLKAETKAILRLLTASLALEEIDAIRSGEVLKVPAKKGRKKK